jgi:hypothetical protein
VHAPFNEGVPRLMNAEGFVVATSAHAARQFALFDETGQWFLRVRLWPCAPPCECPPPWCAAASAAGIGAKWRDAALVTSSAPLAQQ